MRRSKRIVTLILSILLLVTSLPTTTLTEFAAAAGDSNIILGSDNKITRAEWLHNLVYIFEIVTEEEALPDNYYSDLDESHAYYEDILLATEYGIVDIEAGGVLLPDDYVTRGFAASTLNFCLDYQLGEEPVYTFSDVENCSDPVSAQIAINRGWLELIDGAFSQDVTITSAEVEKMVNDAITVFQGQIVDPNYESTYEFAEDVIVLPEDIDVTEDENGVITITDCPVEIVENDKFAVYFNNIPVVYTALIVEVTENVTVITTQQTEKEEAFSNVDAQGVVDSSAMEIVAAEGVDVTIEDNSSETSTFAIKKTKTLCCTLPISFDGFSGKVTVSIENPYIDYSIKSDKAYVTLNGETTVTYGIYGNLAETAGLSKGFSLFTCNIAGVGSFDVVVNVNFSGSATGTVKGFLTAGVECEKGVGIRSIRNFLQHECYSSVNAETSVSLRASLGATKLPVISAYVYAEVGIKSNFTKKTFEGDVTPKECVHFASYLFASYGASASVKFGNISYTEKIYNTIYSESNSPVRIVNHYEDGMPVASCSKGTNYSGFYTKATSNWSGCGWTGSNGAYALNADGTYFNLYNYTLNENNEATITKYNGNSWLVYIPEEIDGYTVVAIGANAFQNKSVRNVILSNAISTIGNRAFSNCTKLCNINLPTLLNSIGYDAFYNCDSLTKINIPKSLTSANYDSYYSPSVTFYTPFRDCDNIKTIEFEEGITTIIPNLFWECTGIEKVEIPDTVTSIGKNSFRGCLNLKEVVIPDTVTDIDNRAFSSCTNLSVVTLPKSLNSIGYDAFYNCDSLTKINIPKSLTSANYDSYYSPSVTFYTPFRDCDNIKTIEFEEGITTIIPNLFWKCTGIEKVEIPDTVTSIGANAFRGCLNLKEVVIPDTVTDIDNRAFSSCTNLSVVTLPKSLNSIGYDAFYNCDSLTKINIPKSLASANYDSYYSPSVTYYTPFRDCDNLKIVDFEEGVASIIPNLFWHCTGLEKIEIPNTVTNIGANAFRGCLRLTEVIIPNTVTEIGNNAFHSCESLTSITLPDSVTSINQYAFYNCKSLQSIEIPDNVTSMGINTFDGCSSLESVKLPNTIENIPSYMFYNCTSLKTIEFPQTLTTIQNNAFQNCTSLETLTFKDNLSLTKIQNYAFNGCSALKEVILPESTTAVGNYAFKDCTSLEKIYIPSSTKTLGTEAFMNCELLNNVEISDYSISKIESNTFKNCPSIQRINLPKGLTTICSEAFMNDTGLVEVIIPESVTSIDSTAFSYPAKTTIYGKSGSYAETFATDGGFTFVDNAVPLEGIIVKDGNENVILDKGETYRAEFEIYPEDANDVITLTANNNNVTINGLDIYGSAAGDTEITVTATSGLVYQFNVHVRSIKNIEVVNSPSKTTYAIGEDFDTTGMVVQVNYNDGSSKLVNDYTISGFDSSAEGTNTITISWKSPTSKITTTYSTTVNVEIVDMTPKLTGIIIDTLPSKLNYELREKLDTTGLVIKATYTDNSAVKITDYKVSGYNALKSGSQTITITYGEYTTTFTISVGATKTLSGISIAQAPTKTEYYKGDVLSTYGLQLTLLYSDNTTNTVAGGFTTSGFDSTTSGTKTITVSYEGHVATFTVTILSVGTINGAVSSSTIALADANTTVNAALAEFTTLFSTSSIVVTTKEGSVVSDTDILSTGMILNVNDKTYQVVIPGDTNGNGIVDVSDVQTTVDHIRNGNILETVELDALAAITGDTNCNILSVTKLLNSILGIE